MLKKNLSQLNAVVDSQFAEKLLASGFHPFKDYTEWVRLVNGDILQIVLFCDLFGGGDLSLYWYSQPISEYLRFDWRNQCDFDNFVVNYFSCPTKRFKAPFFMFGGGIYNYPNALIERINDLHGYIDKMIVTLNEIETKIDVYDEYVKYISPYPVARPTLVFEAEENEEVVFDILKGSLRFYREGTLPEKLKRDFEKVWEPMQKAAAKRAVEEHNLNIYKEFTEKCLEYNMKYLKKRLPELWD